MTKPEFVRLLETMAEGWNEWDPAKTAACFAERVRYGDPTRYAFETREQLLEFFRPLPGEEPSVVWHTILFDEEEQAGVAEYTYVGTHRYHGLVLIRVGDGLVTSWREYQHISELEWEDFVARRPEARA
jgi:hypothetical protein